MKKWMLVSALAVLVPVVVLADSDEGFVARFDTGIGVDPVSGMSSATPPAPVANVVRGVAPGGAPWHIGEFHASVRKDGHILAEGHHLVLAGGNSLGQSLGVSVQAQLFCGAGSMTAFATTTATTLNTDGDFRFDEMLGAAPPDPCVDPVLLIDTAAATPHWLAAGVPLTNLTVRPRRWGPRPQ